MKFPNPFDDWPVDDGLKANQDRDSNDTRESREPLTAMTAEESDAYQTGGDDEWTKDIDERVPRDGVGTSNSNPGGSIGNESSAERMQRSDPRGQTHYEKPRKPGQDRDSIRKW